MAQSASVSEPVVPAGRVSLTTTPAGTVDGPRFLTVIVYVVEVPAVTLPTSSALLTWRSALLVTVSVSVELLLPGVGSVVPEGGATVAVLITLPLVAVTLAP